MAIIEKNGIKFLDGLNADYIVLESGKMNDYLKYINDNKVKAIYLCQGYFFDDNLDFLKECEHIEKVNITSSSIANYNGLKYLQKLKVILLEEPKGKVDLGINSTLEEIEIGMNKNIVGIENLKNIKKLSMWKYRPKDRNLSDIGNLISLEKLAIIQSPINSLKGSECLVNLKELKLGYLSNLYFIDSLEEIKESIQVLEFISCKKIVNHEYIARLHNLEKLSFDSCGEVKTIKFIEEMNNLKFFAFMNTNILDGDLNPCKGLEYVAFTDKRHYSHKNSDFKQEAKGMRNKP